jgi:hypothetical protein
MKEYERQVTVVVGENRWPATLKVIRLPTSWYAVAWTDDRNYSSFDQHETELNGGFHHMTDEQFFDQLQLVAMWLKGIYVEYASI